MRAAGWVLAACLCALSCGDASAGHGGSTGIELAAAPGDPIEFGQLPDFALENQDGRRVALADLRGSAFAFGVIFTSCSGPCPEITKSMRLAQRELAGSGARLVSLSVDPEVDTPAVLAAYARAYGADTASWDFLTGPRDELLALIRAGLRVSAEARNANGGAAEPSHSSLLVAVDKRGRLRGYYSGTSDEGRRALVARLRALAREPL